MSFAGSAISQNAGRVDQWKTWRPNEKKTKWLLFSGATSPPKDVNISERRSRDNHGDKDGDFLRGIKRDFLNVEETIETIEKHGAMLHNVVRDLYIKKSTALNHIETLFDNCENKGVKPVLYYTGHGEVGTGNWCFSDGTISIKEISEMIPVGCNYPLIFSDACYSGHWANFCLQKDIGGFECLAAC